jgi:CBS-domain-containing membrane protein
MALPEVQSHGRYQADNPEKTAGEIMKPLEYFSSVSDDTTVKNAIFLLMNSLNIEHNPKHLLVFESKTLIGIVGMHELMSALEPPGLRDQWYRGWNVASWSKPVFWHGLFKERCMALSEKAVRDIIQPITSTINESASLMEGVYLFSKSGRDVLPVVSNGLVIGLLRRRDLAAEMHRILGA